MDKKGWSKPQVKELDVLMTEIIPELVVGATALAEFIHNLFKSSDKSTLSPLKTS